MSPAGSPSAQLSSAAGLGLAIFSAATFGFGTTFAFLAYQGGSNPLTIVLFRIAVFVVTVGLGLTILGRSFRLSGGAWKATLWMAVTLGMVSLGYQGSVAFIPVSLAALIFYSFPLMVGLLALASGRDRVTIGKFVALVTGFLGLALTLGPVFGVLDWRGIALSFLAALSMALTLTFGGAATRDQDPVVMSVYTNIWMLIALVVAMASSGGFALPVTRLGVLATIALCLTYVIAYVSWYLALSVVRPVRLAALFNIEPLVTLAVAWLALGERLTWVQVLGAAFVLASIVSITLSAHRDGEQPV